MSTLTATDRRIGLALLGMLVMAAPWWWAHDPGQQYRAYAWAPPALTAPRDAGPAEALRPHMGFLWGTDQFGRDLSSRFVAGAAVSLTAAVVTVILTVLVATGVGITAATFGGATDALISTLGDVTTAAPWLLMAIALRAALPLDLPPLGAVAVMALVVAMASWPRTSRHVRAMVVSLSAEDFVVAARAAGASRFAIAYRHLAPHVTRLAGQRCVILLPRALTAEITLSALGLGIAEPTPSWGTMVASLQRAAAQGMYWWTLLPLGGMIVLLWWLNRLADTVAAPHDD